MATVYNKRYFPKSFVAKGDKLFGKDRWELNSLTSYDRNTLRLNVDNRVATISLEEMPGCCGIAVLTALEAGGKRGYGEFLSEAATYWAANLGYTLAIATTLSKNKASTAIATSLRAKEAAQFTNRRTRNSIKVWVKPLPEKSNRA
jgi:hypothetical protein